MTSVIYCNNLTFLNQVDIKDSSFYLKWLSERNVCWKLVCILSRYSLSLLLRQISIYYFSFSSFSHFSTALTFLKHDFEKFNLIFQSQDL